MIGIDTGNTAWVLIAAAMVFFMTPGLALFYGGMARSKNVLSTIMQSFFLIGVISVEFMLIGYTLIFGDDVHGIIGSLHKIGLMGTENSIMEGANIPEMAFIAFQCMFAIITPAIMSGSITGRMRFAPFVVFAVIWSVLIYNPMAHWVWGGGFLANLGALDFAGGLVIHVLSGVSGLVLCLLLGSPPRLWAHANVTASLANDCFRWSYVMVRLVRLQCRICSWGWSFGGQCGIDDTNVCCYRHRWLGIGRTISPW